MPNLSQRGAVHLLVPLILLLGIGAGVYLTVTGNLKLFSKATNPAIVFKSSTGGVLTNNSSGIPQTTSPTVKIELTSTLGAPVFQIPQPPSDTATPQPEPQAPEPSAQTSPVGVGTTGSALGEATSSVQVSGTTSYKLAENPTDLDKASDVSYVSHPTVLDYTFKDPNPGTKFIWVEFKDVSGKVDRQTAQIELVSTSSCTPCSADVSGKKDSQGNIVPDGYINGADASAVIGRGCFNKTTADKDKFSRQCSYLDANGDGKIDMADLNCIKSQFLKKCEARPTPSVTPTPIPNPTISNSIFTISTNSVKATLNAGSHVEVFRVTAKIATRVVISVDQYGSGISLDYKASTDNGSFMQAGEIMPVYLYSGNRTLDGKYLRKATIIASYSSTEKIEIPIEVTVELPNVSKRVFVTSTTYSGDISSYNYMGFDANCSVRAQAAGLGGIWAAWISYNGVLGSVVDRFVKYGGDYKLLNGTVIAKGWRDLTDGSLLAPINIDEFGKPATSVYVWTNTLSDGRTESTDRNYDCNDWRSANKNILGRVGYVSIFDKYWSGGSGGRESCDNKYSLFCFEQ